MNYGNLANFNNSAAVNNLLNLGVNQYTHNIESSKDMAEIREMNQKKLFNEYVNVGISHRIASGLSGRMSSLITEEYCNVINEGIAKRNGQT